MACRAENIYYLTLYRKSFLIPVIDDVKPHFENLKTRKKNSNNPPPRKKHILRFLQSFF